MTPHDDLIARAREWLRRTDIEGFYEGKRIVLDLTAALKECREGGNEMLRLVILKQTEKIQADQALLREAMEALVWDGSSEVRFEASYMRAAALADKIKERLNG